jgi:HPt (histidine-containing phosphotransfer) domain-containing protein
LAPQKQEFPESKHGIMAAVPQTFNPDWHALRSERFDPVSLWERLGEDLELLTELVEILMLEGPATLEQIKTAIEGNDADALSKAAHRLKGSVLQFSAITASAKAAELETMGRKNSLTGANELFQQLQFEIGWLIKTLKTMLASGPA